MNRRAAPVRKRFCPITGLRTPHAATAHTPNTATSRARLVKARPALRAHAAGVAAQVVGAFPAHAQRLTPIAIPEDGRRQAEDQHSKPQRHYYLGGVAPTNDGSAFTAEPPAKSKRPIPAHVPPEVFVRQCWSGLHPFDCECSAVDGRRIRGASGSEVTPPPPTPHPHDQQQHGQHRPCALDRASQPLAHHSIISRRTGRRSGQVSASPAACVV